jgi:hypothetical protein
VTSLTIRIEITVVREVRINLLVKGNDVGEIVQKDVRELPWKKTCDVLLRQRERDRILYLSCTRDILTLVIGSNDHDTAELDVDIPLSRTLISKEEREHLCATSCHATDEGDC